MSNDLAGFRGRCRAMADSDTKLAAAIEVRTADDLFTSVRLTADAALWTRLADEADAWLNRPEPTDDDSPLWEHP